ncbi:hypothetical protein DYW14_10765, partial [Campylobacter coli]|nr:hypothetical protein [Campylobacter coli]
MSGVTRHIFEKDIRDIFRMWNSQLKTIIPILPKRYTKENVIDLLKKYYPHEWESVKIKYDYYTIKDRHINKHKKRTR